MRKTMSGISGSKKGFTLVELVVVIAILAILAAIAIPAVIGIINSANQSQRESEAATIDYACKTYYTGLVTGTINTTNFTPAKSGDVLPAVTTSPMARRALARNCTIGGALEYGGLYENLSTRITDFGFNNEGNIYASNDTKHGTITAFADTKVTFATLNYV